MKAPRLSARRAGQILNRARRLRVLVVGDVMLDHFVWGSVARISPEAPVPVLDFERESFMPGGAANVARNLTALNVPTELFGVVGCDASARQLRRLLEDYRIGCRGLVSQSARPTSLKTRVVAHKQQIVRIDRETREALNGSLNRRLLAKLEPYIPKADAVVAGDYAKGVLHQPLLDALKARCHQHGAWLSLDPKPGHELNLEGLSLITPNRKEAFELAGLPDATRNTGPLADSNLMEAATRLLNRFQPAVLLITLGELGMLLCHREHQPVHIPTVAREVFDVSGAGDTVIACFTLAIATGASPLEAAVFANHAAGLVVAKIGTATVTPEELLASFEQSLE